MLSRQISTRFLETANSRLSTATHRSFSSFASKSSSSISHKSTKHTTISPSYAFTSLSTLSFRSNVNTAQRHHSIKHYSHRSFSHPTTFSQLPSKTPQAILNCNDSLSTGIKISTLQQLSRAACTQQPLQSSVILSTIVGSLCGVATYYFHDQFFGKSSQPQLKQLTFDDIEKLINEPLPETFSNDVTLDGRMHKFRFKEYSLEDYEVVLTLPEEQMPLREKIHALRQLLTKHIDNTIPLYKLLESRLDHLNASVLERIYLTHVFQAKLMNKCIERDLSSADISMRSQREYITHVINFEHLLQLKTLLVMLKDKVEHDFPTHDESSYLNHSELEQAYTDLARLSLESASKLAYYKFLVLQHDLENTVEDGVLKVRLDTDVSQAHNTHGNAFTDAVDTLPAIDIRRRIVVYRTKALDITSSILANIEFFVDAIPAINDMIKTSIRSDIYRVAESQLDDIMRNYKQSNGVDANGNPLPSPTTELDTERLDKLAQQAFEEAEFKYEHVADIHKTFHNMWTRLTLCDENRIGMVPDEEVTELYDSMRSSYLDAKSKEFIPKFFFSQYNLEKPLQYDDLLNKAYLLLPKDELDEPLARYLSKVYDAQDNFIRDLERSGV